MNASCFGHRELYIDIEKELKDKIEYLITQKGVNMFFTGGMGNTDMLFSSIVRYAKRVYGEVKLILVRPYFSNGLNINKEYYESAYDSIIIPDEIATVHFKSAIEKRNHWIIDHSDFILNCTYRGFGGAYTAVKYAKKIGKPVIDLSNLKK